MNILNVQSHFDANEISLNEAPVCNTWFEKKVIHKQTWQHRKSKQWHCIDFAICMVTIHS